MAGLFILAKSYGDFMQKVREFSKALRLVDTLSKIVIALVVVAGFFASAEMASPVGFIAAAVFAFVLWIIKVLGLGIGYTLVQIAENTASDVVRNDMTAFVPEGNLQKQFIELYEKEENADYISDSMHRTYKALKSNQKVRDIVLETAIKNILSKHPIT